MEKGKNIMRSICQQKGKGSLAHNNREFISENVDKDRTKDNVIIKQQTLQDAYKECYGAAVAEYNAKQKRTDRKIDDYFEQLFGVSATDPSAKNVLEAKTKTKSFYEDIAQVGDLNDTGCKSNPKAAELAKKALIDYVKSFVERNSRFHVFNAVIHMDEATPHLHIDYIPVADGYKRGMKVQNGYNKALEQMGFVGADGYEQWRESERDVLREICKSYGLDPKPKEKEQSRGYTYTPKQYRDIMREADQKSREIIHEAEQKRQRIEHEIIQKQTELSRIELDLNQRETIQAEQENVLKQRIAMLEKEKQEIESEKQKLEFQKANLDKIVKNQVAERIAIQRQKQAEAMGVKSTDKSMDLIEKLHGL